MLRIDYGPDGAVVIAGRLDAAQAATAQAFLDRVAGTVTLQCSELEYVSSADSACCSRHRSACSHRTVVSAWRA